MKTGKRVLSILLTIAILMCSSSICLNANASENNGICLTEIKCTEFTRYTGNVGDSNFSALDGSFNLRDDGIFYGYTNIGIDGNTYNNGFCVWIARWNFGDNISWAQGKFALEGKYSVLNGKSTVLKSYNTKNFKTTVYFYNGNELLYSFTMTPQDYNFDYSVDVSGVDELTVLVKDDIRTAGGTSFALYDLFLDGEQSALIDKETYYIKHKIFATNTHMPESFGFYNKVWNDERGKRLWAVKTWDFLGDVGEIVTFKFDDLMINADYYDMFLADLIVQYNEQTLNNGGFFKVFDEYKSNYGMLKKLLQTSDEWNKAVEKGSHIDLEIDNFLIDPDYQLSDGTMRVLKTIFKDLFQDPDKFTKIYDLTQDVFNGLDVAGQICDYISTASDVVDAFVKAYKAYTVAKLYQEADMEFFNILNSAANNMPNTKYANWFKQAVNKYYNIANNDSAIYEWSLSMLKDSVYMTYDLLFKDTIKNITYNTIGNVLNVAPGSIAILTFTYSTTYGLLDKILKIGDRKTPYYLMNYIAPIEEALCSVENTYSLNLINDATYSDEQKYDNAVKYDAAYNLLRCTNLYLYQAAYDFCAVKNYRDDMEMATLCADAWRRVICHNEETETNNSKYISVQCPVNIHLYNDKNELVLSVVDENVINNNDNISIFVFANKKSFIYPANGDYRIIIDAIDSGTMSYYISEISNSEIIRQVEFYDLQLNKNISYSGNIPDGLSIDANEYKLNCNSEQIMYNYDSAESKCIGNHKCTEWKTVVEATCFEYGIAIGYCSDCGKKLTNQLNYSNHEDNNHDGICDSCNTDYTKGCTCSCHKSGIVNFLWKIINFFRHIFGMEQYHYCSCGKSHWK